MARIVCRFLLGLCTEHGLFIAARSSSNSAAVSVVCAREAVIVILAAV